MLCAQAQETLASQGELGQNSTGLLLGLYEEDVEAVSVSPEEGFSQQCL